uniref:Putative secreted protein n=1 Tax=Anopheles marajoara TaxID=58244 RepID=A0A2M4C6I9_9DIPT
MLRYELNLLLESLAWWFAFSPARAVFPKGRHPGFLHCRTFCLFLDLEREFPSAVLRSTLRLSPVAARVVILRGLWRLFLATSHHYRLILGFAMQTVQYTPHRQCLRHLQLLSHRTGVRCGASSKHRIRPFAPCSSPASSH